MKEADRLNHVYKFPTQILRNPQLTSSDKIVAFHLFRYLNKDGTATMPTIKDMVEDLSLNRDTVKVAKANLIANNILSVEGSTYRILLAGQIPYSTTDFHSREVMNMMGNFIKAPLGTLYADGLTSLQKICAMIFFDYFFDENNGKYIRKREVKLRSLHNLYKDMISYDRLKKNFESIRASGWMDWKEFKSFECGEVHTKIMGVKISKGRLAWVPLNQHRIEEEKKVEEEEILQNTEEKVMDCVRTSYLTDEEIEKCCQIISDSLVRKFKTNVSKWPKQEALNWVAQNKKKE